MAHVDTYRAILASMRASAANEPRLNEGGRILLPPSVLDDISRLSMVFPLQFKISTKHKKPRIVYAAVLEFTAERGTVVLPDWMVDHLEIQTMKGVVTLETCNLGAANILKLQPHTQDFIALKDPRTVLEKQLINYPVLTKGASIVIRHAGRDFRILVADLLDPRQKSVDAVLSARADSRAMEVKVEFERPMDMPPESAQEEEMQDIAPYVPTATQAGSPLQSAISFSPVNFRPPTISGGTSSDGGAQRGPGTASPTTEESAPPSFVPFGGGGRCLSGGPTRTGQTATATGKAQALTPEQIREARLAKMMGKK